MRKYMKKELLEIVNLLREANETIQKNIDYNAEQVRNVLVECQQSAMYVGNKIEQIEGEGSIAVSLLEEYCENVYQISEVLTESQKVRNLLKKNINFIVQITNSISYDLPDSKKEIVFLPYKASMWDSLESVWMAARDDENCDVYVIPIPYFDKKTDGTLGQMHYEANEYPDYVPITSLEEYSISEHKPDVIYIHNPYDGLNRVTSVHPNYYAKELKKYTDMLVYIPYFVCMDDVPEHFCVLPGTIYADKVIVQSDKIKRTYIDEFRKCEKENNCKGIFGKVEDKFLALGSPKFDKVINTKINDLVIPDKWKNLIVTPDGKKKKVIMYNTNVTGLLNGNEEYIEKVKYILKLFRDRKDVVLWWRPHPLNKATYSSMKSQYLEEYEKILEDFRNQEYGILDETSDLNRAIAASDVYYGDGSSIVALYKLTGKPIMHQNIQCKENNYNLRSLYFSDMFVEDNLAWIAGVNKNAIFTVDFRDKYFNYVTSIPYGEIECDWQYVSVIKIDEYLYLIPRNDTRILKYDIQNKNFSVIPIEMKIMNHPQKYNLFTGAVNYKENIYLFPARYPAIVQYNLKTGEITYHKQWYNEIKPYINNFEMGIFNCYYQKSNCVFLAFWQGNKIMKYNMDSQNYKIYTIGKESDHFSSIEFDGTDFWIAVKNVKKILKWNLEKSEIQEYCQYPKEMQSEVNNSGFRYTVSYDSYVLAFPIKGSMIMRIDKNTSKAVKFFDLPSKWQEDVLERRLLPDVNFFMLKRYEENKVICYSIYDDTYIFIDLCKEYCEKRKMEISKHLADEKIISKFYKYNIEEKILENKELIFYENERMSIEDTMLYLSSIKPRENNVEIKGEAGAKIHNIIRKHTSHE